MPRPLHDRPVVTRLVVVVVATMAVVLLAAGAFVFWRVQYALDRQLDQDLAAYQQVVQRAVATGDAPPHDTPGQSYQVYDLRGRVIGGDSSRRLVGAETVVRSRGPLRLEVGHLLPVAQHSYLAVTARVQTVGGTVVVASAISRSKHDEALRELLLQLAIADLATLLAASLVGYRTARAALSPVERYRAAAARGERADGSVPVLPVATDRDDEVTRLGHTLNALLARIGSANERERQFVADASHELRSPLALMRAELDVALLRPRTEAETAAALGSLRTQVDRLVSVSNALLDLEELRAGGTASREPVDLVALAAEVAQRYARTAATEGRRIEVAGPEDVGAEDGTAAMDGNRHWLELALTNLVANALRHGDGTVTVRVTAGLERATLAVGDEGPGFPDDFAAKAFDRFSRVEVSRSTRGTGLGLALVRAVAEAHDGTATVSGATVTLDLPTRAVPG